MAKKSFIDKTYVCFCKYALIFHISTKAETFIAFISWAFLKL